jgi:hypothetical protein
MNNLVITNNDILLWIILDIIYLIIALHVTFKTPKEERNLCKPYLLFTPFGFIPMIIGAVILIMFSFFWLIGFTD